MNIPVIYEVLIEKNAEKGFKKLPAHISRKIGYKIHSLKTNPKPSGYRKITGSLSDYRIRLGDYRIIYELNEKDKKVIILAVGHRKDIYRQID